MTQSPGNWPDPERHGVPMFPERDGWHWIDTGLASGMRPLFWQSKSKSWFASADTCANQWKHTDSWKYHGPCLTPAQISEMLAAERERCAKTLERDAKNTANLARSCKQNADSTVDDRRMTEIAAVKLNAARAIRNLGAAP